MDDKKGSFYYTDPLAAAWMAKHFGMAFSNVEIWDCYGYGLTEAINDKLNWQIHPDSLHLLDGQEGDFGRYKDKLGEEVLWHKSGQWMSGGGVLTAKGMKHFKGIIQRNGKAFIWPESE